MPTPSADQLPQALTTLDHWVGWRTETREGSTKPTKVPYNLGTGYKAASNNPEHWVSFPDPETVPDAYDGIGFVFTKSAGFTGVDLDDCLIGDELKPWAAAILQRLPGTYAEVSPSGTGIKVWTRAALPGGGKATWVDSNGVRCVESESDGRVEMYDTGRYFCVTGQNYSGSLTIAELQEEVTNLYNSLFSVAVVTAVGSHEPSVPVSFDIPAGSPVAEGGRHRFLLETAAKWRARGMEIPQLLDKLRELNAIRCHPPKPDYMLEGIAKWFEDKPPRYKLTARDWSHAAQWAEVPAVTPALIPEPPPVQWEPESVGVLSSNISNLHDDLMPEGAGIVDSAGPVVKQSLHTGHAAAAADPAPEPPPPPPPDPSSPLAFRVHQIITAGQVEECYKPSLARAFAIEYLSGAQSTIEANALERKLKAKFEKDLNLPKFRQGVSLIQRELIASAAPEASGSTSGLPQIMTTSRQLRDITTDAIATINPTDSPVIFIRSGELVHVHHDEISRPSVMEASPDWIRGILARSADWMKINQFGEPKPTFPPMDVIKDIAALGSLPFPALTSVTEVPTLRGDGTIISKPGYDAGSGVFYSPAPSLQHFPLPDEPTREQVTAAVATIDEAIGEFPYENEASKANIFGLLLTPVLRPAIIGCTPLAVVDAPQAGTGKSLLIDVLSIITTGRPSAMVPYPYKEEEMQKQIGASLASGRQLIAFDNLEGELKSPCLALALTAKEYEARILGFSRNMTVPNVSTWIVTGNNIRPAGDMPRRCYQIRLNAKQATPYRGREFRHPDLLRWVSANRSELLHALLVIARFWFYKGCPDGLNGIPAIGSFEDWHRKVAGILRAAQVKGFLANYTAFIEQEDESPRQWEGFLEQLFEDVAGGEENSTSRWFTVSDMLGMIGGTLPSALRDAVPAEIADCMEKKQNHQIIIGKMFRSRRERRFGSYWLERKTDDGKHKGAASWRVRKHG